MQKLSCQPVCASSACKGEVCWIETCPGAALERPLLSWQPEASLPIYRPPMLFPQQQRISSSHLNLLMPAVLARLSSAALRSFQALHSISARSPGSLRACSQPFTCQCWSHSNSSRALQAFSLSAAPSVAWPQECLRGLALIYGRGGIQIGVRLWYLGPLALTTGMSCICSTRFDHEACCDSGLSAVTE